MKEYYITMNQGDTTVELTNIVGKVVLFDDTQNGRIFRDVLSFVGPSVKLCPFGTVERDDKGNITNFDLMGFSVKPD